MNGRVVFARKFPMNRTTFAAVAFVLGLVVCAAAAPEPADPDQALHAQLDQVLPQVKFTGGFADAIEYLHNLTRTDISVDLRWMGDADVAKKAPVTVDLHDIPFSKALESVLTQAGDQIGMKLRYDIDDGTIYISVEGSFEHLVKTRTYDIHEFMIAVPNFKGLPTTLPGQNGQSGGDAPGQPIAENNTAVERADDVRTLIVELVESDSWKENGGSIGSICELAGNLIITTTPKNHERIKQLLSQWAADNSRVVRVRAIWVVAREAEVAGMLKKVEAVPTTQKSPASPLMEVEASDLEKLPGARCEAQTLAMEGKRARVSSAYERPFVRGDAGGAEQPATYDTRVWLDVLTALSTDGQYATVILHPQAAEFHAATQPAKDSPGNANNISSQDFQTFVRLPVGKTILMGSSTLRAGPHQADALQLFLFVQVTSQ